MRPSPSILRATVLGLTIAAVAAPLAMAGNGSPDDRSAAPVTYSVIGDTPYGQAQIDNFANDIAEINADPRVRLVIHVGDIKNGSTACDTSYFQTVLDDFGRFADPLVYTPGDNEWTDCHRTNNGSYDPLERLTTLREMFFATPGETLGQRSKVVDAQAAPYVENVRWSQGRVEFATLDVPGSNNDWAPWFNAAVRTQAQIDEVVQRDAANVAWLDHVFASAADHDSAAIVLAIQADMWDPVFTGANDQPASYDHFTNFVQALAANTRAWGRPVLLLNGDSHIFNDEHPLAGDAPAYLRTMYGITEAVPNLRRITTNGSTTACHEWLRLTIDSRAPDIFSYERELFTNQPGFDPATCPAT